jgi:hypothetical protein
LATKDAGPRLGGRLSPRARSSLSVALIVLGALTAVVGIATLYVKSEVIDSGAFADRAVDAIHKPPVRDVVAQQIVVRLIERGSPDLVSARPVLQSVVGTVIAAKQFNGVIRKVAEHGHRLLFQRGATNAAFDIGDAATVVTSALRRLAPKLAAKLPAGVDAVLLTLRKRTFASETLRAADKIRVLGLVLPAIAFVLLVLGILVGGDRRTAVMRTGVAVGIAGVLFAVALELTRVWFLAHVHGAQETTTASIKAAVGGVWDAYLGDLMALILAVTAVAWLVAASLSPLLAPYSGVTELRELLALARRPVSPRGRSVRGGAVLAVGVFIFVDPTLAGHVVVLLVVAVLVYIGLGELLSGLGPAPPRVRRSASRRRRAVAIAAATTVAAGVTTAVALSWGSSPVRARAVMTCNGYAQLCDRRLDEVVFAGTHNAMSAADSPGWYIANQERTINVQLQDGIRAFKISTHYGVADAANHVRTDLRASGARLNRVSEKLTPQAREALQRLGRALGFGPVSGTRDIFLCHTLCELGATKMVDFLTTIRRFLDANPGQVIIFFDEDYVAESALQSVFQRAGLFSHLETLEPGKPLPTMGELVRSGRNVLVFAQEPPSKLYRWDMNGFDWIQDTPLGAVKPAAFTCLLKRGLPTNPLLMMNNWADLFPPRLSPNIPLVKKKFILKRANQCLVQRSHIPNLILTDFYDRGDVIGAVRELNGLGNQKPATTVPVN